MPGTACLHLRSPDSDAVRVVEIHGASARIGRAVYCDVRLSQPGAPDEVCRLVRRGGAWQLNPVRPAGLLRIAGVAPEGPRPLALDDSFQVGDLTITLRAANASAWDREPKSVPPVVPIAPEPTGESDLAVAARPEYRPRERWSATQRETKKWESRWRAVGEKMRTQTAATVAHPVARAEPVRRAETPPPPTPPRMPSIQAVAPARVAAVATPTVESPRVTSRPAPASSWKSAAIPARPAAEPPTPRKAVADEPVRVPEPPKAAPVMRPVAPTIATPPKSAAVAPPEIVPEPPKVEPRPTTAAPAPLVNLSLLEAEFPEQLEAPPKVEVVVPTPNEVIPAPEAVEIGVVDAPDVVLLDESPSVPRWEGESPAERVSALEAEGLTTWDAVAEQGSAGASPSEEPVVERTMSYVVAEQGSAGASPSQEPVVETIEEPVVALAPLVAEEPLVIEPIAEASAAPIVEPPPSTTVMLDDEEAWDWALTPPAAAPTLGSARRMTRADVIERESFAPPTPPEILDVDSEPVEATQVEPQPAQEPRPRRRPASRRSARKKAESVAAPPIAADAHETATIAHEAVDASGWVFQAPFVTDARMQGSDPHAGADTATETQRAATESRAGAPGRDWPTVGEILAAQGVRARSQETREAPPRRKRAEARRPIPTTPAAPAHWSVPLWLGWLPTAVLTLGMSLAGLALSWIWTRDAYNAGLVARRLEGGEAANGKPLPEDVAPSGGPWWRTTATNLVEWAAYVDQNGTEPDRAVEARALVERAAQASPLNPSARFVLSQETGEAAEESDELNRKLAQSHDVLTLTRTGHRLLEKGRKEAALKSYHAALEMAAHTDVRRPAPPLFLDDSQIRRYGLPSEELLGRVIRDMADSTAWTYREWCGALPAGTAARVVAARVLRERVSPDADAALEAALAEFETPREAVVDPTNPSSMLDEALRLAAEAEAMAMKQKWTDAEERYLRAIDLMPVDMIRRAWWLNVADIALRLNEEATRQQALDSAKSVDPRDQITQRAVELQKKSGYVAQRTVVR